MGHDESISLADFQRICQGGNPEPEVVAAAPLRTHRQTGTGNRSRPVRNSANSGSRNSGVTSIAPAWAAFAVAIARSRSLLRHAPQTSSPSSIGTGITRAESYRVLHE